MKTVGKILVAAGVVVLLAGCPNIALKDTINRELGITSIRVGSVADSRSGGYGWTLDGSYFRSVRSKMLNPANFGPSGTVKKTILITDFTSTITGASLQNIDVFFIGFIVNGTLSASELTALETWVSSGGTIIISADEYTISDAIAAAFGYPLSASYLSTAYCYPQSGGMQLFSGPFGDVYPNYISGGATAPSYGEFASWGSLTPLGYDYYAPFGVDVAYGHYGSGKVILLSTVDFLSDDGGDMTLDNVISSSSSEDKFMGNVFASIKP